APGEEAAGVTMITALRPVRCDVNLKGLHCQRSRGGSMAASYNGVPLPKGGSPITFSGGRLEIPDNPIIPYIEGDGTGRDIWAASVRVFDRAVERAYGGKRKIHW